MNNIFLKTIKVGDIQGHFFIPSYQRGYRWGKQEVGLLIKDIISSGGQPYCLQPIVVRRLNDRTDGDGEYELIDGQQRLTTLYLLYKYFHDITKGLYSEAKFTLTYETREKSEEFLKKMDMSLADDNIDYWYISQAYKTISELLPFDADHRQQVLKIDGFLKESVNVIWYEVPDSEEPMSLFQRLNIGKIQLTASELVKALFLREGAGNNIGNYQEEIALQWDNIERELHEESLWAFLTNHDARSYATRIDLVLDLISGKKDEEKDSLFTFFYFDDISKEKSLYDVWKHIQSVFLLLKDWCADHNLYHWIGYLIASDSMRLNEIYELSKDKRKKEFSDAIQSKIRESVFFEGDILELRYGKDNKKLKSILLLFNVESVRTIDDGKQWFPFSKYKENDRVWSLEHIHAQHSEGLDTNEKRAVWVRAHLSSLVSLRANSPDGTADGEMNVLIEKMEGLLADLTNNPKRFGLGDSFNKIQEQTVKFFSKENNDADMMHCIENLALLDVGQNAALSNYVFDAKRNMIIEMDKSGAYIPFCTKMVFFKYYTEAVDLQVHFWGAKDRSAYLNAIKEKLTFYLTKENFYE